MKKLTRSLKKVSNEIRLRKNAFSKKTSVTRMVHQVFQGILDMP